MTDSPPLLLGCPVWACPHWKGKLYTSRAARNDYLRQYSSVFGTVEVNSTFYALPPVEMVARWADETLPGFQFCLKFPKAVTHEKQLRDCTKEMQAFLRLMEVLRDADRLGPAFLQLPPDFNARHLWVLCQFLERLPGEFPYSVEVRHPDWFDGATHEQSLNTMLADHCIDRCLFDSRALFSKPPADQVEQESQRRKPRSPFRTTVTATRPMIRIVGRNRLEECRDWLVEWAQVVAGWIESGLRPVVFTHAPDDALAPEMARQFHTLLRKELPSLDSLPGWLGEREAAPRRQRSLF